MANCKHNDGWDFVFVRIRNGCVTVCRCKKCQVFGTAYCTGILGNATEVGLDDLPEDFREYLIEFVKRLGAYD